VLEEALAEVAQDPWRFEAPALVLTREGLTMVRFAQSDPRMVPASQRLHNAVVQQRLTLPETASCASTSRTRSPGTRRGWRLDRAHRLANIDGVVALAMALERAEQRPDPVRVLGWL
jgi:hypothetical protein